jgi:hypothetical protein
MFITSTVHAGREGCFSYGVRIGEGYTEYYTERGVAPSIDTCLQALEKGTPIITHGSSYTQEIGHYLYDRGIYKIYISNRGVRLTCIYYGQVISKQCE